MTTDKDPVANLARTFILNGENKQITVKDSNGNNVGQYFYDGEENRVKKITNTETTIFVYSSVKLVAEYSTQLATSPSINYTTTDHLGSPRIITDELGQVKSRRDFMPFGEELYAGVGARTGDSGLKYSATVDAVRQKFTGYQKDGETSLDFAEARMYENRFGRFTSVDPLLASGKSAHPQSFNRYVYVGANPLLRTDPEGLDWFSRIVNGITKYQWSSDNKFFKDGSSVEDWTAVEFNPYSGEYYYDGCVDADCTKTQGAVLYQSGGWDWTNSASFAFHSLIRDELREFTSNWNYFKQHGVSGMERGLRQDFNDFAQDPLGERGLGNQGLAFVTGGVSQEAQLLKGFRIATPEFKATTEAAKDTVLYEQYSLRAAQDGMYPVMERGLKEPVRNIFLKEGEVWKFGQTMRPATRYSQSFLDNTGNGLRFFPESRTTSFKEVLQIERQKILEYEQIFGKLPPGNKIRR